MEIAKEKTVAFTGNRTLTTSDSRPDTNLENVIRTELAFCLEQCYEEGKNCFISGLAVGWDLICSEEVLKLKLKYPDVVLIGAVPFMGQELMYSEQDKQRYAKVFAGADHIELITEGEYDNSAYHKRNDWMLENCSEVLAYDSGKRIRSGASSTIRKARAKGLFVSNFFEEFSDYFQITHPAKHLLQRYPHITSFRYGREGLVFEGDNRPHFLPFDNIESVEPKSEFLIFKLRNGVTYKASIFTEECFVDLGNMPDLS